MKVILVALVIPAALLISFREPNGRLDLSDLQGFAHLCTEACAHICSLRK
jgi:hypothetical protein